MNNKFSLSFGIAFIIVGLLNIFFETNNAVLFALSISAAAFSIVNVITAYKNKLDILYIIPFALLISILCYNNSLSKNTIFINIINSKVTNIITFISFGSLFISEYIKLHIAKLKDRISNYKICIEIINYSSLILELINKYLSTLLEKKIIIDEESKQFLSQIDTLCKEKAKQSKITAELLDTKKDAFNIDEFNNIYVNNNDIINIEKNIKKYK